MAANETKMPEPLLTTEDIKSIELALPIVRALAKVEPLLKKASQAHELLSDVKRLEMQRARQQSENAAEHAVAVRNLEAALDQARVAAEVEATRKQESVDGKIRAAEQHLMTLRRDSERMQESMNQIKLQLERETELLRLNLKRQSEESSQAIGQARQELEATKQCTTSTCHSLRSASNA